jgi:cephalosporin hydroxylase
VTPEPPDPDTTVRDFHRLYYKNRGTWMSTRWLGHQVAKCPLDVWVYQELIFETKPDVIIETGSWRGGSALYLASLFDLIGSGRVITIDVHVVEGQPEHSRLAYLIGSSTAPEVVQQVKDSIGSDERVMVILDSNHRRDHVIEELRAYAPLVTKGNYLIVEDTNVNGHPVRPRHGPGPMEAVDDFLAESDGLFEIDSGCEKFLLTFNPRGYLRRV